MILRDFVEMVDSGRQVSVKGVLEIELERGE
jgi:hypothetical protein